MNAGSPPFINLPPTNDLRQQGEAHCTEYCPTEKEKKVLTPLIISGEQFFDHTAVGLGQLFVAAFVEVGELVVVEAQEMQDRAVEVFDVVNGVDGLAS